MIPWTETPTSLGTPNIIEQNITVEENTSFIVLDCLEIADGAAFTILGKAGIL